MREVVCNFCGSSRADLIYTLTDRRLSLPDRFNLVQCRACGLLYLNPQPDWHELERHYPDHYAPFTGAIDDQAARFVRWARRYGVRRRCRSITRRVPAGRLLDVGCSTGVFLDEMRRQPGWNVAGVEPVAPAATYAAERFGLDVFHGTLLDAAYAEASFDVVTMWDVLEHVADPSAYVRETWRILKPGGWLVLKVPDLASWEARMFGPYWAGHEAPRHLHGFTRLVLERQLRGLGFALARAEQIGSDYATFVYSLAYRIEAGRLRGAGRFLRRLARATPARVASAPALGLLRRAGLNSSLTLFARKVA